MRDGGKSADGTGGAYRGSPKASSTSWWKLELAGPEMSSAFLGGPFLSGNRGSFLLIRGSDWLPHL